MQPDQKVATTPTTAATTTAATTSATSDCSSQPRVGAEQQPAETDRISRPQQASSGSSSGGGSKQATDNRQQNTRMTQVGSQQQTNAGASDSASGDNTTQSNDAQQHSVKQFSEKSLEELANFYLNLEPADIPDCGFVVAGIAGRFPNADNLNELWENLYHGRDMVLGPDDKRWPLGLWDLPKKAARIKDISQFDNEFFGISKETADYTDHQLRNLYEVVYESILDAGLNPAQVRGNKRFGMFFGFHTAETDVEFSEKTHFKTTGYQAQLLTAITDYFDIQGVVGSFDAACASSFAAFHQAVLNLRSGLVDSAIVCGVNISVRPGTAYQFLLLQMLSPTGSSKFLDASADGYAKTEACVSVILTRADLAKRSYASIVHTKCNNDGFKVEGITYPSSQVQETLMTEAIIEAGVDPKQIVYVEAHGTGTPAGDPEEARAIAKVYCENRDEPLLIGSVKSNMGHAEGVSGLCSLAKVICTFENELLPCNLHYNKPNPNIQPLVEGRLKPVVRNIPFKHNLIPMNCYGFGGVNVHGIFKTTTRAIEPKRDFDIAPEYPRLVTMFGRSQAAIEFAFEEFKRNNRTTGKRLLTRDYLALLDSINEGPIDKLMNYRGYMLVDSELNEIASSVVQMNGTADLSAASARSSLIKDDRIDFAKLEEQRRPHFQDTKRKLWYVLPGLGCQWRAMGRNLVKFAPIWNTIEQLADVLRPFGVDLIDTLTNTSKNVYENNVVNLFTGIVAVQIGLIDLLTLLEAKPAGIIGHSIGEISCAYADGLLTAKETILLAYYLAKPIDDAKLHTGSMVAVSLSEQSAIKCIKQFEEQQMAGKKSSIEVACLNGEESVTLSGLAQDIDMIVDHLTEDNVYARKIVDVRTAFHNSLLRQIEGELLNSVQKLLNNNVIQRQQFKSKNWYTTLYAQSQDKDGKLTTRREFEISAQYYVDNLCSPVLFRDAMNSFSPEESIIIEIGPHGLFHPILKQRYLTNLNYASLMKRSDGSVNSLLINLGQLYQHGQSIRIANLYPKVEFPVAKGTGSISSYIRWNHSQKFHVAKYPEAFRRPPCEARVKFDLIDESDKYLSGHCVDGRILFPATGYLFLVWRSYSLTKDKVGDSPVHQTTGETVLIPVEFRDVRLYRATILGSAPVELLVRIEEATGQFEVREGGSVVADGYISQPRDNPDGLMYDYLKLDPTFKDKKMSLETDDVYKQFRVCGYDYGESFRNIVKASSDGLRVQVKWTGKFIPFSDSVLQSLFLAICKKTSALFLPTKFEYMRINPKLLQAKVDAAAAEEKPCILDAYCELETGIIVTDGVEMRGVGASPAPRRLQQEPVLETYQFVPNIERNISDRLVESFNSKLEQYIEMCSTAAYKILSNLQQTSKSQTFSAEMSGFKLIDDAKLNKYMDENEQSEQHALLQILDKILASQEEPEEQVERGGLEPEEEDTTKDEPVASDTDKKNTAAAAAVKARERKVNPKLRPAEELQKQFERVVRQELEAMQQKLGTDLMSGAFGMERFLRPLLEMIFENSPSQKVKMLELNTGSGIKYTPIANILGEILPTVSINYFFGHPDTSSIPSAMLPADTKLYTWSPSQKQLARELQDIDFILYNDSSLYPTKRDQFTQEVAKTEDEIASSESGTENDKLILREDVGRVFESAYESLRSNGFMLAMVRTKLAPAEKFLYKVCDFDVNQKDERLELVLEASKQAKFKLIAEKTDKLSGCVLLLFRKLDEQIKLTEQKLLHLQHGKHANWFEALKSLLADVRGKSSSECVNKNIWLVANDTPNNGIVGMVNCLRREPGGERIRFIFDQRRVSPFKFQRQELDFERIIKAEKEGEEDKREACKSDAFIDNTSVFNDQEQATCDANQALVYLIKQDLTYNCIDQDGRLGAFRHFTISDILENQRVKTEDAHVNVATRGDLSSFRWYEAPYKYYGPELKQNNRISIYYSSLNFRDIMLASGRLPLDALPVKIALSDCILGLEFSGRTSDGRRVAGMLSGRGIATTAYHRENESIMFPLPDTMSLEEGATIPVVYITAAMALILRGKMVRGETILIHSGSGGVGQAAIRLCLHYGITVYTTVGNQEKRDFLKQEFPQLTDAHIFNSRDCTFETDVMRATKGRGVDLVLNSLSEDKLQASVRCLADGGRFLEIGKYDMAVNNAVELMLLDTNKTFHGILLDKLFDTQTLTNAFELQIQHLVDMINTGLAEGYIQPIKRTVFDRTEVEDAFRFMASGKHIGKVIIKIRDEEYDGTVTPDGKCVYKTTDPYPVYVDAQPRPMFDPKLSYIITGGLGGFGLELAKWMGSNGARALVLTSRSGIKTGYQELVVERLREHGVTVEVSLIDNTTDEGAEQLVQQAMAIAPLGGIFNLAMVLKDSLIENATVEQFDQVCAPKSLGVAALDRACRKLCPDLQLFVAFSSVSCGKGNAGQTNYGYANSVMERICEQRRRDNMHGLAIQWGAIGDVGVAFEHLGGNEAVIGGTIPQRMPSCFATLGKFLSSPFSVCLSILQADRRSFSAGKKGDLVKTILHVLGIKDPASVDPNCTLGELGLDSLMAVEIRQALERDYDIMLTVQEIRALTINRIREIGESDLSKKSKGDEQTADSKLVSATDELGVGTGVAIYRTENDTPLTSIVPGVSFNVQTNGVKTFVIDKNLAAKAPLALPQHEMILLNGDTGIPLIGNPIFLVPPIQGDFSRISTLVKKFSRPCVGLCWTERMAKLSNIGDAAKEHVNVIRQYYPQLKTLDLIGYSFGATVAFEIMVHIQNNTTLAPPLKPGKLVLLDGSPEQINIGLRYITKMIDTKEESVQVAELLTVYLMQHSRFDYNDLKAKIMQQSTHEQKLKFAVSQLATSLGIKDKFEEEQLSVAAEAFVRRFQIMLSYRSNSVKLDSDVTLIRASEVIVGSAKDSDIEEDYGLSKIVTGRVNSCLLKGNHESFLDDNVDQISSLLQDIICPVLD